jgi:hypothetical protein
MIPCGEINTYKGNKIMRKCNGSILTYAVVAKEYDIKAEHLLERAKINILKRIVENSRTDHVIRH